MNPILKHIRAVGGACFVDNLDIWELDDAVTQLNKRSLKLMPCGYTYQTAHTKVSVARRLLREYKLRDILMEISMMQRAPKAANKARRKLKCL